MRFSRYPIRWRVTVCLGTIMLLWLILAFWQGYQWSQVQTATPDKAAQIASRSMWVLGMAIPLLLMFSIWLGVIFTRSLVQPIRYARNCTRRLAQGDLTVPVERRKTSEPYGDEIQELLQGLQLMYEAFIRVVGKVRSNAENVATTAEQIAIGNLQLSHCTHQQAESLQQTAKSINDLTTNVRDSAENAEQANQLAHAASMVASRGSEITQQLVQTMEGIEASSKRIADITGLIDTIAFQTSMLALNAAVEASRAGDRGKGFAVVANEVRQLAQRSAVAAREIKTLIEESVNRVASGAALVNCAGITMHEIVESTRNVSAVIAEITEATKHQNEGIFEVSAAMASIDSTTQQNASWASNSANTSEELKRQAFDLVAAVSLFRL